MVLASLEYWKITTAQSLISIGYSELMRHNKDNQPFENIFQEYTTINPFTSICKYAIMYALCLYSSIYQSSLSSSSSSSSSSSLPTSFSTLPSLQERFSLLQLSSSSVLPSTSSFKCIGVQAFQGGRCLDGHLFLHSLECTSRLPLLSCDCFLF